MSTAKRLHYTYAEYLQCLNDSDVKLEYCDGVIYAMAGGTLAHAALSAAMIRLLSQALPTNCMTFTSDARIRIEASGLSTFPDVSVACGERMTSSIDANALVNPTLLVEVTSASTEDYDRGDKLSHYKQLPSLKAVLFVSHRAQVVTLVERAPDGWTEREFRAGERLAITEPKVAFDVDELYRGIALDPPRAP